MTCEQIQEDMSAYLDGELAAAARTPVEAHLAACPACKAQFDELATLCGAVKDLPQLKAPANLLKNVHDRVQSSPAPLLLIDGQNFGAAPSEFKQRSMMGPIAFGIAAILMLFALAFAVMPALSNGANPTAMRDAQWKKTESVAATPAPVNNTPRPAPFAARPEPEADALRADKAPTVKADSAAEGGFKERELKRVREEAAPAPARDEKAAAAVLAEAGANEELRARKATQDGANVGRVVERRKADDPGTPADRNAALALQQEKQSDGKPQNDDKSFGARRAAKPQAAAAPPAPSTPAPAVTAGPAATAAAPFAQPPQEVPAPVAKTGAVDADKTRGALAKKSVEQQELPAKPAAANGIAVVEKAAEKLEKKGEGRALQGGLAPGAAPGGVAAGNDKGVKAVDALQKDEAAVEERRGGSRNRSNEGQRLSLANQEARQEPVVRGIGGGGAGAGEALAKAAPANAVRFHSNEPAVLAALVKTLAEQSGGKMEAQTPNNRNLKVKIPAERRAAFQAMLEDLQKQVGTEAAKNAQPRKPTTATAAAQPAEPAAPRVAELETKQKREVSDAKDATADDQVLITIETLE